VPELPEAETIVRGLAHRLPGRTIVAVGVTHADVLAPPLTPATLRKRLRGATVEAVERRGKKVVLATKGGGRIVVNLGMTGRLVLSGSARAAELSHVAVRLELDDGQALLFDDVRRFGRIELHDAGSWSQRDAALGTEPLSDAFTAAHLHELAQRSRTPIRNWLLDQRRVAGIGNIYANEALFRAGIDPARPASSLTVAESAGLRDALRAVLAEAIVARGTTLSDYRDEQGEAGRFAPRLQVYGRAGQPCIVCERPIERAVLTNRSIFFCGSCQR
jgi:formamidopyrimidine-DNA glycosylase